MCFTHPDSLTFNGAFWPVMFKVVIERVELIATICFLLFSIYCTCHFFFVSHSFSTFCQFFPFVPWKLVLFISLFHKPCSLNTMLLLLFWRNYYLLDKLRIKNKIFYFTFVYSFSNAFPFFRSVFLTYIIFLLSEEQLLTFSW